MADETRTATSNTQTNNDAAMATLNSLYQAALATGGQQHPEVQQMLSMLSNSSVTQDPASYIGQFNTWAQSAGVPVDTANSLASLSQQNKTTASEPVTSSVEPVTSSVEPVTSSVEAVATPFSAAASGTSSTPAEIVTASAKSTTAPSADAAVPPVVSVEAAATVAPTVEGGVPEGSGGKLLVMPKPSNAEELLQQGERAPSSRIETAPTTVERVTTDPNQVRSIA